MTDVATLVAQARAARQAGDRAASLALFRAGTVLQPDHHGLRLEAAADLLKLGRSDEAEAAYREVLARDPAHTGALVGLGQAARRGGRGTEALGHFRQAVAADPGHIWARMEAASELRSAGLIGAAEAEYQAVVAVVPEQSVALLGLAACARARGDVAGALALHSRIVAAEPGHKWARLQMAADLRDLSRFAEAEQAYHKVLADDPASDAAFLGLGQCARRQDRRRAALAWHQLASLANPKNDWCRLECAVDLRALGELEAARSILAGLLAEKPGYAPVLLASAQLERQAGDRQRARQVLGRAVQADPGNAAVALELAAEHRFADAFEEARMLAASVLRRQPGDVPALVSLAQTEQADGQHAAALEAFTAAHVAQPGRADLLLHMAAAERALGRVSASAVLLARARAAEPGNVAVFVAQAEQARMGNDIAGMHALYADALALDTSHLGVALGYAESLVLLGRADEALAHLDQAEAAFGGSAAMALRRVSLLRRVGHWHAALAAARALTDSAPGDFAAWMERLLCESFVGGEADIDACLAGAPAGTRGERARLARMRARVCEDRGLWAEAAADYRTAIALDTDHPEGYFLWTRFCLSTLDLDGARAGLAGFMRTNAATLRARGQGRHASQTHYGQVLDEYLLDHETVVAVQAAQAVPQIERVGVLLRIVDRRPDSTAAAVALVHALRKAGFVRLPASRPVQRRIPTTIVQFWDTPEIPADVEEIMRSWSAMNPDYGRTVFSDAAAHDFLSKTYGKLAGILYARLGSVTQKADVFRLGFLARHGGVYADSDDRCHAPLETIIPPQAELVVYQEDFGSIGNNFIAASPRQRVIMLAFRLVMNGLARGDSETVWLSTGPGLTTRALAQGLAASGATPDAWLDTIVILDRRELFRAVAIHCYVCYKSTERHWSNVASNRGRKLR